MPAVRQINQPWQFQKGQENCDYLQIHVLSDFVHAASFVHELVHVLSYFVHAEPGIVVLICS